MTFVKLYGIGLIVFFALDMLWLGVVAKNFYAAHFGHLTSPAVRWAPALLFYLVYVAALITFVVLPGLERESLLRVILMGAFFGLATYAAFDLTGLALLRDFPTMAALVDMAWGASLGAIVSSAVYIVGR